MEYIRDMCLFSLVILPTPITKENIMVYSRPGLKETYTKQDSDSLVELEFAFNFQKLSNIVQQFL